MIKKEVLIKDKINIRICNLVSSQSFVTAKQ